VFKGVRRALQGIGVIVFIWALGLVIFVAKLPKTPDHPGEKADAIVVLTGGAERIPEGFRLLDQGLAPRLLISGVASQAAVQDFQAMYHFTSPQDRVSLDSVAVDTAGNARETALWLQAHNLHSVRLVTAFYHMPRSMLMFRRKMPNIHFMRHPVIPSDMDRRDWWAKPRSAFLLVREYHKYLMTLIFIDTSL
jgi:uncharacterized SAM-binding protein YcdF (DUF218 family)